MNKILLDTNLLLLPQTHKIDVFQEIEHLHPGKTKFFIPQSVYLELKRLASEKGRRGRAAKVGLALIGEKETQVIEDSGYA
ncbi:MAG: hypothetical protein GF334_12945, partial [Candidatus Altiarchaeales archaeon]|nr:hypothetical protein [Candidatus Altiarchaeales archaeon]